MRISEPSRIFRYVECFLIFLIFNNFLLPGTTRNKKWKIRMKNSKKSERFGNRESINKFINHYACFLMLKNYFSTLFISKKSLLKYTIFPFSTETLADYNRIPTFPSILKRSHTRVAHVNSESGNSKQMSKRKIATQAWPDERVNTCILNALAACWGGINYRFTGTHIHSYTRTEDKYVNITLRLIRKKKKTKKKLIYKKKLIRSDTGWRRVENTTRRRRAGNLLLPKGKFSPPWKNRYTYTGCVRRTRAGRRRSWGGRAEATDLCFTVFKPKAYWKDLTIVFSRFHSLYSFSRVFTKYSCCKF